MTLIYLGVGWLVGIGLAAVCPLKWLVWLVLSVLPIAAAIIQRKERSQWRLHLALAFLLLGAARYRVAQPHFGPADLASYNGAGWGEFEGYVAAEPDPRAELTRLTMMVEGMQLEGEAYRRVSGLALLEAPAYSGTRYGDRLRFAGRLETPPQWDEFSYRDYLARKRIYSRVRRPIIEPVAGRSGSPVKRVLFDLKEDVQRVVQQIFPDPEGALLSGILLGNEGGIPGPLMEDFNATGTSHIIAISGYNINIILGMLFTRLKRWIPRRPAGALTIAIIVAYTLLVGAKGSVVRAAIMGSLIVVGEMLGRKPFIPASLMAAAIGMTAVNPLLLWDPGSQLSFAASMGLVLLAEPLKNTILKGLMRVMGWERENWVTRLLYEGLLLTLAAQITTLPLILFHFGRLSLVSLVTNLLILPVQPYVMAWGGLATAAGLIALGLGRIAAWLGYLPLWWTIRAVEAIARIRQASIEVELTAAGLVVVYVLIFGVTYFIPRFGGIGELWRRLGTRGALKVSLASAAISVITVISLIRARPDGRLHVTFLDVGEGEAILIETPTGRRVLVDGGPDPAILQSHLGRKLPFWDRSLDLVIATHPDSDHVNGLPAVLERYQVETLITNGQGDGPPSWEVLLAQAEEAGIPQVTAVRGQTVSTGDGVDLEVLHPGARPGGRYDDNSIVLRVRYGDTAFLLTGDAGTEVEAELIEAGVPLQSTVLKAADSGDRDGTSQPFLDAVAPNLVIFSVGDPARNPNHHPAERVLERVEGMGCGIGRTDQQGSIHLITDGEELWVETDP